MSTDDIIELQKSRIVTLEAEVRRLEQERLQWEQSAIKENNELIEIRKKVIELEKSLEIDEETIRTLQANNEQLRSAVQDREERIAGLELALEGCNRNRENHVKSLRQQIIKLEEQLRQQSGGRTVILNGDYRKELRRMENEEGV